MGSDLILVWDNEEDHLEILAYNLAKGGYDVLHASDEEAVVSAALAHMPGLVILGNCSSEERRAEMCRQLKDQPSLHQIPVLCLTTDDHCWDRPFNKEAGINSCIILPTKPKHILKEVKALLQGVNANCREPES